jgi:hypothetical protein
MKIVLTMHSVWRSSIQSSSIVYGCDRRFALGFHLDTEGVGAKASVASTTSG